MSQIKRADLYEWCSVPVSELENHPALKIPFRLCSDPTEMGRLMAREFVDEIKRNNARGEETRAIVPCGPSGWYEPFACIINEERVSLERLVVLHMDECLDWEGKELPRNHPYSFRGEMERRFYNPIDADLGVPEVNRFWLNPSTMESVREQVWSAPIDVVYGGWGQDGHVAYNQARRNPFSQITVDELRQGSIRIQENSIDTILALAQRTFGAAYQFVPPMSITLGMKECLSGKKIRLFSDTGAWKQTALRVALFSEPTTEYPITLLQGHPDVLLTATIETATHPISKHPEWNLGFG